MKIAVITPAPARSRSGNRNTASRWAGFLRDLGHSVRLEQEWSGEPVDMMIALHARRSYPSIHGFARAFPERPLVVALTGTDLYRDIAVNSRAQQSLELAAQLVVLQELGPKMLPPRLRRKIAVIYQSAAAPPPTAPLTSCFEVVVSGHLREEKDPFRAAAALQWLPPSSRMRITHIGRALTSGMRSEAERWMLREQRYRWLGELPHWRAIRVLARSRALVISSRMEGGANVVSEALACGVPVIASRIDGNVGMLGSGYPAYFRVGDERALARLLTRIEREPAFRERLIAACAARAPRVLASTEREALAGLIVKCFSRERRRTRGSGSKRSSSATAASS